MMTVGGGGVSGVTVGGVVVGRWWVGGSCGVLWGLHSTPSLLPSF